MTDNQFEAAKANKAHMEALGRLINDLNMSQVPHTHPSVARKLLRGSLDAAIVMGYVSDKVKDDIVLAVLEELKGAHEAAVKAFAEL